MPCIMTKGICNEYWTVFNYHKRKFSISTIQFNHLLHFLNQTITKVQLDSSSMQITIFLFLKWIKIIIIIYYARKMMYMIQEIKLAKNKRYFRWSLQQQNSMYHYRLVAQYLLDRFFIAATGWVIEWVIKTYRMYRCNNYSDIFSLNW